jgi:hypothetical protein
MDPKDSASRHQAQKDAALKRPIQKPELPGDFNAREDAVPPMPAGVESFTQEHSVSLQTQLGYGCILVGTAALLLSAVIASSASSSTSSSMS